MTGVLPYSRLRVISGQGTAVGDTLFYALHRDHFPALEQASPELVQRLVGIMNDRSRAQVRAQERAQERDDKLRALGKLSAGLAHELNNPAAAIARAAQALATRAAAQPRLLSELLELSPDPAALCAFAALAAPVPQTDPPAPRLCALEQSKREDELADQRMPDLEGVELLTASREFFPEAKRVLLTAYADTEAAVRAINSARLDHYLMKPWDPPDNLLYPTLHDLLTAWQAPHKPRFDGVGLIGFQWSPLSHELKDFLSGYLVGYQWLDYETSSEAQALVKAKGFNSTDLPLIICADGKAVANPSKTDLANHLGIANQPLQDMYDVVVGAGPSGRAAAVYGASEGLRTLIIERQTPGGQAGTSSRIENYLGFPTGLSGADLAFRAWSQAVRLEAEFLAPQGVTSLCVQDGYKVLTLRDGREISTKAVVLTTGVSYRTLDVPGMDRLSGAGVYYGAARTEARSCDAQDVYIVGGGNSAGPAAMYLATYARRVFIVTRGADLAASMSAYLIEQIRTTPNIELLPHAQIKEGCGGDHLEAVRLDRNGPVEKRPARALFVFIGAKPSTEWVRDQVLCDGKGFVLTGRDLVTDPRYAQIWQQEREPYLRFQHQLVGQVH